MAMTQNTDGEMQMFSNVLYNISFYANITSVIVRISQESSSTTLIVVNVLAD